MEAHESLSTKQGIHVGIDVGGTRIDAATLDAAGNVLSWQRAPDAGNYPATIEAIVSLVGAIENELHVRTTVGVGTPAFVSPTSGMMRDANAVAKWS